VFASSSSELRVATLNSHVVNFVFLNLFNFDTNNKSSKTQIIALWTGETISAYLVMIFFMSETSSAQRAFASTVSVRKDR